MRWGAPLHRTGTQKGFATKAEAQKAFFTALQGVRPFFSPVSMSTHLHVLLPAAL